MDVVFGAVLVLLLITLALLLKLVHDVRAVPEVLRTSEDIKRYAETLASASMQMTATLSQTIENVVREMMRINNEVRNQFEKFISLLTLKPAVRGYVGESLASIILSRLPEEILFRQLRIGSYRVDFAIELRHSNLILPIDAKFTVPENLLEKENIYALSDKEINELSKKILARAEEVKKYIRPDLGTTDFAIMFVPDVVFYHLKEET